VTSVAEGFRLITTSGQAAASGGPGASSAGTAIIDVLRSWSSWVTHLQPREAAIDAGLTLVIGAAAFGILRLLDWLLRRGVERLAARGLVETQQAGDGPKGGPRIAALSWGLLKLAITVTAALIVLQVWGLAPLQWLSGASGAALARVAFMIVLGVAVVEVGGRMMDRMFLSLQNRTGDHRRAAQFRTLAPIVRGLTSGLLVILIGLTALSEMGVKIAPLLAGAGVIGVALGFGAQTLVKDFITGLFLILEDIVSVGDNVKIGGVGGQVETMTLRTIRLRDFDGTLHVFPYSEAQVIHNQTKSFSYAVMAPKISYVSDIEKAQEIMREIGGQLRCEKPCSEMILEPLELVGVDGFTDVGVIVKGRIKTRPGKQWLVGREFQRRLKLAFDAQGIEIGYPNVYADRPAPLTDGAENHAPVAARQ
jgi:small conductance mechanosensitive channel